MYLILVYDVSEERVAKVCKRLRQRLTWVQNSVFEGEVTEADLRKIEHDLGEIIEPDYDSVLFYLISHPRAWEKRSVGKERNSTDTFI